MTWFQVLYSLGAGLFFGGFGAYIFNLLWEE